MNIMAKKSPARPELPRAEAIPATAGSKDLLHLRFGWWCLLGFLSLGIALEALHGLKIGWFLDVSVETRRFMFRLAHAHGTLLALVNIAFGTMLELSLMRKHSSASFCLIASSLLIPLGFLLGGVFIYDGDPGLGILLVPVGALLLLVGIFQAARGIGKPV
jgi:hypothetical protein